MTTGAIMRVLLAAERVRFPGRNTPAGGRLGHRPVRRVIGLRGARCTGAGEGPPVCIRWFQEARPGAELRGKTLGECRGGAPRGERAASGRRRRADGLRAYRARACLRCGPRSDAPVGAPPPVFKGGFFPSLGKARARSRRGNDVVCRNSSSRNGSCRHSRGVSFSDSPIRSMHRRGCARHQRAGMADHVAGEAMRGAGGLRRSLPASRAAR